VGKFAKNVSASGGFAPCPPDQGLCPWTNLGVFPQTTVIEASLMYSGGL